MLAFSIAKPCRPYSGSPLSKGGMGMTGASMIDPCVPVHDEAYAVDLLACLLARGILRLRDRHLKITPESSAPGLALCSDSCPLVVDAPESKQKDHST